MSSAGQYSKVGPSQRTLLGGNLLLALFKGVMGWLSGSKALMADGIRSVADASASLAPLLQERFAKRSTSRGTISHSDHSRGEGMAKLLVSVMLLVAGLEIGISGIRDIAEGVTTAPKWYAIPAIIAASVIRAVFFKTKEGLSGLYCSLAALIGASTALVGGLLSIPALYYFDPAAAIIIAVIVMNDGYRILSAEMTGKRMLDGAEEEAPDLAQFVQRIEGVVSVESLKAREHGHYVVVEVVISVNPRISVLEGNEIARRVKLLLMKRYVHITDVIIYVEPYDAGYPYKSNHDPNQEQMTTLLQ